MGYKRVMISAGHGSKIEGACGNGYREHVEATKVMNGVAKHLISLGVQTVTFEDTYSKNQKDNVNKIVQKHNCTTRDLDVSIHFNSSANATATGVEVLYYTGNDMKNLSTKISKEIANVLGLKNRGAKVRTDLGFLKRTAKPAILIEVCFISNANDMKAYVNNFDKMCKTIAYAIAGKEMPPPVTKEEPKVVAKAEATKIEYRLFTGTYKQLASAKKTQEKFLTLMKVVYLRESDLRVITGTFKTKESAEAMKKKIKETFNINVTVQEVK